jgi:hypothetical protein
VAVVEGLGGDVLGFVWATAVGGELLPGQPQLLTLIHDGVLQPLSEEPVVWQPVVPPTMKLIPRMPTNVHRENVTRMLVILHWFRQSIAGFSLAAAGAG